MEDYRSRLRPRPGKLNQNDIRPATKSKQPARTKRSNSKAKKETFVEPEILRSSVLAPKRYPLQIIKTMGTAATTKKTSQIPMSMPASLSAKSGINKEQKKEKKLTPSFTESFEGRIEWKKRHNRLPVTSTPKPPLMRPIFTDKDLENCFGFNKSEEMDSLISPIKLNKTALVNDNKLQQ